MPGIFKEYKYVKKTKLKAKNKIMCHVSGRNIFFIKQLYKLNKFLVLIIIKIIDY